MSSDQQRAHFVGSNNKGYGWVIVVISIVIFFVTMAGLAIWFDQSYAQRILPGVYIGRVAVGGMTADQALEKLKELEQKLQLDGFTFQSGSEVATIHPVSVPVSDPDLAQELVYFDWQHTVDTAVNFGHSAVWSQRFRDQIKSLTSRVSFDPQYTFNTDAIERTLRGHFASLEQPGYNAQLHISGDTVSFTGEQSGTTLDYVTAIAELNAQVQSLDFAIITINQMRDEPEITLAMAESARDDVVAVLDSKPVALSYENDTWTVPVAIFKPWLELQIDNSQVVVGLDTASTTAYLVDTVAADIDVPAENATFKLVDNEVTEFRPSQDGLKLDIEQTYALLNGRITSGVREPIELPVSIDRADVETAEVNDLGIVELLGRGWSNFAGSPANRRHNIAVGAGSVDGQLIAPGETFSMIKALGDIDGAHGYLQELVIKGDRTIPEYGGGLCQVGTTAFRAALDAGLPIVERRNHSYRVGYYEPPIGMDATIYDPAPDLKFTNDTPGHLLWVTRIDGSDLYFELYGTNDGRVATTSEPIVYNITSPGEPRYIETDELEPGVKKKVESAHAGAEAEFTYTVTYPDGEVAEEVFYSRYVPWKETWLVGKEPTTTEDILLEGIDVAQ